MSKLTTSFPPAAVFGLFVFGVAWWISFRLITAVTLEDALITYRYAQNLALGNGFVFNTGEQVLGTTTPLFTILLAVVGRVLGVATIPLASTVMTMCFGVLTGIILYCVLTELEYPKLPRILFIPLFFGNELIMVTSVGGMETPLVLFFMAASTLTMLRRQPVACLLTCALLVTTRPDGLVWGGVMSIALVLRSRRLPWTAVLLSACVVLPWLVFALWYFDSPLPHSIAAKRAIGGPCGLSPCLSLAGLKSFMAWYISATGFSGDSRMTSLWLLVIGLGAISYLDRPHRRTVGAILIGYVVLYGLFLYAGRAPYFERYLAPVSWCSVLLSAPGVWNLSRFISRQLQTVSPRPRPGPVIAVAVVASTCFAHNRGVVEYHIKYQANECHTRRAIGLWLRDNTPRESVVAMEAIGYQAFFSERRIIDLAGVVTPGVVKLKKATTSNAELFFKVLSMTNPDYVVLRSFEVDENRHFHGGKLFETEEQRVYFDSNYKECERFAAPYPEVWGQLSFLTIYARYSDNREAASNKADAGDNK